MSTRMPNGILNQHHHQLRGKQYDAVDAGSMQGQLTNHKQPQMQARNSSAGLNSNASSNNNNNNSNNNKDGSNGGASDQQRQPVNILNVAEMILHGVADNEILDIWLRSIACQEFAHNFVDAGYDMPTISRITPQDLTAIGITDPTKRSKILSEIKKLNLQDGIPTFKPVNLSHWLSLLRLDSQYHKSLCDQHIDTIDKTCQLTWEDFEELGITKLGHQKRLMLAIERMKELDTQEAKVMSKPISEPIYDTNPSQILLVASAENHSMNGPIMNKQSSTSELSSTGSGSMHSLYSANSIQYHPNYATLPPSAHLQQLDFHNPHLHQQQHQLHHQKQSSQQQNQAIYSQPPSQLMQPPQQLSQTPQHQLSNGVPFNNRQPPTAQHTPQHNQNSHYQSAQSQFISPIYDTSNLNGRSTMMNRQSLGQLPFSALANLPKHQQQLLQQSSIYATLSRQPQRVKQPPPPVPIRTNSLKTNSLTDEETNNQSLSSSHTNSTSSLFRSGTRVSNRNQFNSQTLLSKNKSFSGGAYMDAARARFLNRNNQQQQSNNLPPQPMPPPMTNQDGRNYNQNTTQNLIYSTHTTAFRLDGQFTNGRPTLDSDNQSLFSQQSVPAMSVSQANSSSLKSNDTVLLAQPVQQMNQRHSVQATTQSQISGAATIHRMASSDDHDRFSDTNSTKSLILQPSKVTNWPVNSNRQASLSQDSGSSQTLYNSASSGSNDQNMNVCNFSQSRQSTVSNSTLNDVNLILDQQVGQHHGMAIHDQRNKQNPKTPASTTGDYECNATTGKDDDFPPPPSPLSLTEFEEHNINSINPDSNFTDISQGLMTFRVGS